jgi:hypothetical protein
MPTLMETLSRRPGAALAGGALALILALGATGLLQARADQLAYPTPAPLEQYRMASRADEIALARSAAPASVSSRAEVLTLGAQGYDTAVKGDNGFVCLVLRAWASGFGDAGFWNPRMRGPICYNPAAARSVLPTDLRRAQWALAGASKARMLERTKAAIAAHEIGPPEVGAMSYMMSKDGYLNDRDGHWHPHLMFLLPRMAPAAWGANLAGAAVMADDSSLEPLTVFFVPVPRWSDGTSASMGM